MQLCIEILESLRHGDFGKCDAAAVNFNERCKVLHPYALAFSPPSDTTPDTKADTAADMKMTKANNIDDAGPANILLNGTEP